ncbi:MAG: TRAP transporter fused permease subunit [Alphaproteobacteria bacterium]|nr:TRAP transporter fused permease subunit [Alphaproteobacteria bacterium]
MTAHDTAAAPGAGALARAAGAAAKALAVGMAVFHLYTAFTVVYSPMVQRGVHLGFALALLFLITPAWKGAGRWDLPSRCLAALAGIVVTAYAAVEFTAPEVFRVIDPTKLDLVLGTLTVALLLEATRRTAGPSLAAVALAFFLYAFAGPWLPGMLGHPGFDYAQVISSMYIRLEGVFGTATGASATYIYVFVLFGAFMMRMGGGDFFIDLAQALIGTARGSSAKVSVFASALFATITGTGPANAAAVGVVTIPTMIRSGYPPRMAAALEAAASVGGQITPPIMGASAFIMADLLNVPYFEIAKAAALPALLYFVSLFITADLEAARHGLKGVRREELPRVGATLRAGWHFLVPVGVLLYLLMVDQVSPSRAGAWAAASFLPVWLLRELLARRRIRLRQLVDALDESSRAAVMIAAACAVVGIVMNVTDLTGLGLKFTSLIVSYSGGSLFLLLCLTAIAAILLGTGLPTTATYLIVAILVAPALAKMGVPLLTAHLFVFYFGVVSDLTPPTAVSCYVAGGIAGESGMKVAFSATRVALPALIVPFMFVYEPGLLLMGSPLDTLLAAVPTMLGIVAASVALIGYWACPLRLWERAVTLAGAVLLIFPGLVTDGIGALLLGIVAAASWRRRGAGSAPRP